MFKISLLKKKINVEDVYGYPLGTDVNPSMPVDFRNIELQNQANPTKMLGGKLNYRFTKNRRDNHHANNL